MLLLNSIKFFLRTTQLLYFVIYPVFQKSPRPKADVSEAWSPSSDDKVKTRLLSTVRYTQLFLLYVYFYSIGQRLSPDNEKCFTWQFRQSSRLPYYQLMTERIQFKEAVFFLLQVLSLTGWTKSKSTFLNDVLIYGSIVPYCIWIYRALLYMGLSCLIIHGSIVSYYIWVYRASLYMDLSGLIIYGSICYYIWVYCALLPILHTDILPGC